MLSTEITFYQWALLYFLCFINKPSLVNAKSSSGMKFQYERHRSASKIWSTWTHWSECSRTCGGGVRMRSRHCRIRVNGYSVSNDSCLGESVEHELCSTSTCSPIDKDFLEYQCSLQNGLVIAGKRVSDWLPYKYGVNSCQLQCWSKVNFIIHSFGKVMDGTKCSYMNTEEEEAICINGRCSLVDCSGKIGSFKQKDKCGICDGNNSTCVKFQNTFWKRPRNREYYSNKDYHYEYDEIFRIPTGATNILVQEASKTNFLALVDQKGKYFINGNWRVDSPGKFNVHGSEFIYNRTWDGTEILTSMNPTRYILIVLVMGNGDVPTVQYEYWMSTYSHKQRTSQQHTSYQADPLEQRSYHTKFNEPKTNPTPVTKEITLSPKLQGYNSFYHRNEILKSVPSWSIKRFSNYKNPLNILSYQNPNHIYSVDGGSTTEAAYWNQNKAKEVTNNIVYQQIKSKNLPILNDKIVPLDSAGRPTGTSAQMGNQNKVFEYNVQDDFLKQNIKNKSNIETIINRRKEKSLNTRGKKKKNHNKRKRKSNNDNCQPCPKSKRQTKHFCLSDFVLQAVVLSFEKQQENIRFEIEVTRSFKNKIPIMPREYIWSPSHCQCPKLGLGKKLIIMGNMKTVGNQRESRLVVDDNSFVRKYTHKRARTMLRLLRDQTFICKRY
ncbi:ADAMTS-like protein 5 [Parasteatoda tepidariorum]|uniref:ADAMTS-like protein 5 n=1 Tax=Parasteatoda tepidariorum TaxID=114398 RepID=UPI0039BC9C72